MHDEVWDILSNQVSRGSGTEGYPSESPPSTALATESGFLQVGILEDSVHLYMQCLESGTLFVSPTAPSHPPAVSDTFPVPGPYQASQPCTFKTLQGCGTGALCNHAPMSGLKHLQI